MSALGRRLTLNDEMIEVIRGNIILGMTNKDAAIGAGISPRTFYMWYRRGKDEAERLESSNRARARQKEEIYLKFYRAVLSAEPRRKQIMIGRLQQGAAGTREVREVREVWRRVQVIGGADDGDWQEVLIERTITTRQLPPVWQIDAWFLERKYPEFRRVKEQASWYDEVLSLIQSGDISLQDAYKELGNDLSVEFYERTGVKLIESGEATDESGEDTPETEADPAEEVG